jgi:peroxiredoxin
MYRTIGSPLLIAATMLVFQPASVTRAEELEIGAKAPEFKAQGIDGREYTLKNSTQNAKATVIAFTCNQCPVAQAYEERFTSFQKKYADRGVQFIAINVNASENLDSMKERAKKEKLNYAYAYDESGDSARAFGARVTPHLFVIDSKGLIAYQGSFDDKQSDPTTPYVENAVNALLAGKQPDVTTTKAFGCGIKPKKK